MLSEKSIQEIEKATGIIGLQEIISNEEAKDVVFTKTKHFSELDYNVLYDNLTKQSLTPEKYEEAKTAGEEMAIKAIKKSNEYDFEGKTAKALTDYLTNQIKVKAESDVSEIEKELQKDIEVLRKKVKEKDTEISGINLKRKTDVINSQIDNQFSGLQIEPPAHLKDEDQIKAYIKSEIEKNKLHFKSQYQFDVDDSNNIITKNLTGEIQKNELTAPETIDNLVNNYVKGSFMNLKQTVNGRGAGDSYPDNILSGIQTQEQLDTYAKSKGVIKNTSEYDALYSEFMKSKN